MSLNDIAMPDSLIDALYRDSLLIRSPGARASPPPAALSIAQTSPPPVARTAAQASPNPAARPTAQASPPPGAAPKAQGPQALPATSDDISSPSYKFLGNNLRKVAILLDSPDTAFLPDDQLSFLTKMLEACKMNIGDVAIVNQAHSAADIGGLKRQFQPAQLLLFGPAPTVIGLPINFPQFKIQAYDQCSFLWVPPLDQLVQPGEESKLLKTKLWICLKTLFGI